MFVNSCHPGENKHYVKCFDRQMYFPLMHNYLNNL